MFQAFTEYGLMEVEFIVPRKQELEYVILLPAQQVLNKTIKPNKLVS